MRPLAGRRGGSRVEGDLSRVDEAAPGSRATSRGSTRRLQGRGRLLAGRGRRLTGRRGRSRVEKDSSRVDEAAPRSRATPRGSTRRLQGRGRLLAGRRGGSRVEKDVLRVDEDFLKVEKDFLRVDEDFLRVEKDFLCFVLDTLGSVRPGWGGVGAAMLARAGVGGLRGLAEPGSLASATASEGTMPRAVFLATPAPALELPFRWAVPVAVPGVG